MQPLSLRAHPATLCVSVSRLEVSVGFRPGELIDLDYRLYGELAALCVPAPILREAEDERGARADGLWQHTCCEIFVRVPGENRYFEWNFAPSGAWAFYGFDGYRVALPEIAVTVPPRIRWHRTDHTASLQVEVPLADLPLQSAATLQVALSAVIETTLEPGAPAAPISYWALTHPPGKPDFHHPDNFVLTLPR